MAVLILMDETVLLIFSQLMFLLNNLGYQPRNRVPGCEVSQSPIIAGYIVNALDSPLELLEGAVYTTRGEK